MGDGLASDSMLDQDNDILGGIQVRLGEGAEFGWLESR